MGIGWVQELVSRLTKERITQFDTTVNGTLVSSPVTFPFNQPIYVDATHDTVVSASASFILINRPSMLVEANYRPLQSSLRSISRRWQEMDRFSLIGSLRTRRVTPSLFALMKVGLNFREYRPTLRAKSHHSGRTWSGRCSRAQRPRSRRIFAGF
jgi:hypothetical protein